MDKDSKFTRDEDGYVAVRTVSAPYSSGSDDKDSMFTRDEDGYVAVRVTGSGGGDQHNLGWYATESALTTAHSTAEAGDWAIVGATDTVWVWDTDTTAWKDTGAAGIELPDQTGNDGKFLTTNGTSPSWKGALGIPSTSYTISTYPSVLIDASYATVIGCASGLRNNTDPINGFMIRKTNDNGYGLEINIFGGIGINTAVYNLESNLGFYCSYGTNGNNLGTSTHKWANTYTKKINNGSDITVPAVGGTMVVADYTGATQGQVLTLNSSGNAEWATPSGGGSTGTTASLVVANWSSNTQTVNVTGVTASNNVIVAPAPASQADYTAAGIICTAQGAGTLTFTCTTVPSSAITVNVLII